MAWAGRVAVGAGSERLKVRRMMARVHRPRCTTTQLTTGPAAGANEHRRRRTPVRRLVLLPSPTPTHGGGSGWVRGGSPTRGRTVRRAVQTAYYKPPFAEVVQTRAERTCFMNETRFSLGNRRSGSGRARPPVVPGVARTLGRGPPWPRGCSVTTDSSEPAGWGTRCCAASTRSSSKKRNGQTGRNFDLRWSATVFPSLDTTRAFRSVICSQCKVREGRGQQRM